MDNTLLTDNPYYFYNETPPRVSTPDQSSGGGKSSGPFSFFRRRSSSGSSSTKSISSPSKSKKNQQPIRTSSEHKLTRGFTLPLPSSFDSDQTDQSSADQKLNSSSQGQLISESRQCNIAYEQRVRFNKYRQRLGSYNESVTYSENDDVFTAQSPTRKSINQTPSNEQNARRHSIGTTVNNKDRGRGGSFSDEVPKTNAPKPPISQTFTGRGRYDRKNCEAHNMDDILIVTSKQSEPAILWANYLKNRFDKITKQRGRLPFNFLHIKIDEGPITADIARRCKTTKLQIVILCSSLISLSSQFLMSQLSLILKPDIVLGILLEVPEDKILEIHKTALPSFKKWRRCVVRNQDQSFVGNVLGIATDILGRALCQRPLCTDMNASTTSSGTLLKTNNYTDAFTVLPRKVKIGQNKVVALLNEPLTKEDWIRVHIEKNGETIEVINLKKRNPYTLQFTIPESCMDISTMIEIKIDKNDQLLGSRPVKCESRLRELEQLLKTQDSPLEFMCHSLGISMADRTALDNFMHKSFLHNMPPNFHLVSSGPLSKHNHSVQLRENASVEYPTLLHFAAKYGLDQFAMQLMECPGGDQACEMRNCMGKLPADLAEMGGFSRLGSSLKSFSQMHELSTMYHYFKGISDSSNSSEPHKTKVLLERSPQKLSMQYTSIDNNSTEYLEMNGSSGSNGSDTCDGPVNAVTNLNYINIESKEDEDIANNLDDGKVTAESEIMSNELKILEPAYYESNDINSKADEFSQVCSNVLENCRSMNSTPIKSINSSNPLEQNYLSHPKNTPINTDPTFGDYLIQPSNRPVEQPNTKDNGDYLVPPSNRPVTGTFEEQSHYKLKFKPKPNKSADQTKSNTLKRQGSDTSKISVDDELLEIINDFKNNVFSIQEVEQLVSTWKNRNDVQQSYRDKQEQLQQMRDEYDRIQEQMKEKMKRPTPFERFKKLFTNNKNGRKDEAVDDSTKPNGHRPMSSLSIQSESSTTSSGRTSMGSECSGTSFGDSGTHSDHEDRRNHFNQTCRVGTPGSLMDNYLVPPPPRPVITPTDSLTPVDEKERPQFPTNRTPTDLHPQQHYVFFPSNIPVFLSTDHPTPQVNHHHEYMNFNGLKTIDENKESNSDTFQSQISVQPIKVQKFDTIYGPMLKKGDLCSSFKCTSPTAILSTGHGSYKKQQSSVPNPSNGDVILSNKDIQAIFQNINDLEQNIKNTPIEENCREPVNSNIGCSMVSMESQPIHDYINL